jgi:hypothetical protein
MPANETGSSPKNVRQWGDFAGKNLAANRGSMIYDTGEQICD